MQARDSDNRLLARGPRVRLEAEMIRDQALRVSGLLSPKIGGPSVFPPQPPGVTTEGAYGRLDWKVSQGPDRYRRGLYTFSKRTAPYAMFSTFDGPSGEVCVARREVSNTPLQALTLLNDPALVEASQALGTLLASRSGSVEDRIDYLVRRVLCRPGDGRGKDVAGRVRTDPETPLREPGTGRRCRGRTRQWQPLSSGPLDRPGPGAAEPR